MIHFTGMLHVGDVIKEANGIAVFTPEQLMDIIRATEDTIKLKIIPTFHEQHQHSQVNTIIITMESLCLHQNS